MRRFNFKNANQPVTLKNVCGIRIVKNMIPRRNYSSLYTFNYEKRKCKNYKNACVRNMAQMIFRTSQSNDALFNVSGVIEAINNTRQSKRR